MNEQLELGGPEWLREFERLLRAHVARGDANRKLSICEVYTGVPGHLDPGGGAIAWHCEIEGRDVAFELGEIPIADFKVRADYAFVRALAKWIHDPATADEYAALREEGLKAGKLQAWGDRAQANFLHEMHNEIALITR